MQTYQSGDYVVRGGGHTVTVERDGRVVATFSDPYPYWNGIADRVFRLIEMVRGRDPVALTVVMVDRVVAVYYEAAEIGSFAQRHYNDLLDLVADIKQPWRPRPWPNVLQCSYAK